MLGRIDTMRTLWHIILAAVAVGCTPKSITSAPVVSTTATNAAALDEARAIAIARQAVSTNDTWVDRAIFKATRENSGWSVWVWREPRTPGGDRIVLIDEKGRVTSYYRGE